MLGLGKSEDGDQEQTKLKKKKRVGREKNRLVRMDHGGNIDGGSGQTPKTRGGVLGKVPGRGATREIVNSDVERG